jgi:hypothetical protein
MTISWFLALVVTLTIIFIIVMAVFSKAILEGFAMLFAKVVNRRIEGKQRKGDRNG